MKILHILMFLLPFAQSSVIQGMQKEQTVKPSIPTATAVAMGTGLVASVILYETGTRLNDKKHAQQQAEQTHSAKLKQEQTEARDRARTEPSVKPPCCK